MSALRRDGGRSGLVLGPATKGIGITLLAVTLIGTLTQRVGWIGVGDLIFTIQGILSLELWRLLTYPFVELGPLGLLLSLVFLYFFGRFFEMQWGSRAYLRFYLLSSIGAGVLAIPLSLLFALVPLFRDISLAAGPSAAFNAMLVSMAVTMPDARILFGFVLPMRARTAIFAVLGLMVVYGIMEGAASLSITLGGMAMGYLLTTGTWRPQRLLARLRMWRMRRRRRGLHVVKPGETLH